MKLAVVCILLSLTSITSVTFAEDIKVPVVQETDTDLTLPSRGQTQLEVLSEFGEPTSESVPIGEPAISRWHYEQFIVVFEEHRVLSTVSEVESD
ncbi:hypothetical protein [uncultured Umboniibacter sp.]|uniref:hypothetical protein n=1 Tax=uncultured Umboniibacter sp. TaxID=1798917 RepID=UPI00262AC7CE|nr:hypothetical protein [uncultured Umboniibacter sp.]